MKTSDSISKIAPALLQAQRAITFAVKDSKNPAFRSTYADLSSVIDACKPALNEAGVFFMQMPAPSEPGTIALTTRLIHESGEWIESTATCPLPKNDPQGYGSANTYLRRYSLAAAVGLYQDDDDGNAARHHAPAPQQRHASPDVPAILRGISGAASLEVLKANYEAAIQMLPEGHHAAIRKAANARKAELTPKEHA